MTLADLVFFGNFGRKNASANILLVKVDLTICFDLISLSNLNESFYWIFLKSYLDRKIF